LGGTHNDSWQRVFKEYVHQMKTFMEKCSIIANQEYENEDIEDDGKIERGTINDNFQDLEHDLLNDNESNSINKEEDTYLIGKKDE
jgi:hypothetical protein